MKNLTIKVRERDGIQILYLSGALTRTNGDMPLKSTVKDLVEKGSKTVLLDMGDVAYMDSTGIVELVSAHTSATSKGARLKLTRVGGKVLGLLEMVRVLEVFETYPTVEDALQAP